jgi:hypothetical protein
MMLKRLPIIRHLHWLYWSWQVEQHYAMWRSSARCRFTGTRTMPCLMTSGAASAELFDPLLAALRLAANGAQWAASVPAGFAWTYSSPDQRLAFGQRSRPA